MHLVRFLDGPGPIKLHLPPARYTSSTGEPCEALGACKFTSPARSLRGSNVTYTNLEARRRGQLAFKPPPRLLDSSPFFFLSYEA